MKPIALGILLLACAAPAWAVHKCTAPGGNTVFQDTPCIGTGQELSVKPASGGYSPAAGNAARARLDTARALETEENLNRLRMAGQSTSGNAGSRCPNAVEIRNMETSASSITLSKAERLQRQEQIQQARNCGH